MFQLVTRKKKSSKKNDNPRFLVVKQPPPLKNIFVALVVEKDLKEPS